MRLPLRSALALCLLATPIAADDWVQYRGPDSTGVVEAGLPAGDGDLALEVAWKSDIGSAYSGVAVQGDVAVTVFVAGENDVVGAFSTVSGEELWRATLEPTYKGHDGSHDGAIATPLIAGDHVYALGAWGRLSAFELATGEQVWTTHLVEDVGLAKPWYGFGSSPLAAAGSVITGGNGEEGTLVAFDLATGEVRWRVGTDSIHYQSPILTTLADRAQVVVGAGKSVFAADPDSGELLWSFEHGGSGGRGAGSLTVLPLGGDRLFIDHDDHKSALLKVTSTDDGYEVEKVWEDKALVNSYIPPVSAAGSLYGYSTRFLTSVDPSDGSTRFRSREPGDGFPIIVGDQMVVLTKAGTLHWGPVPEDAWTETGSLDLFESHSWTPPAFANGSLFVRSFGQLARVDLSRGAATLEVATELPAKIAEIVGSDDPAATADRLLAESMPPWIDGNQVTFVWRGEADDVAFGGDVIGVRAEEPMHKVAGTDVWWWAGTVPDGMRFSYAFLVDYEPTLDPYNSRKTQMSIYGPDMNFARTEDPIEMSWMAMPGWEQPEHWADLDGEPQGRLDEHNREFQLPTPDAPPEEDAEEASEEATEEPEPVALEFAVWTPPGYDDNEDVYPVIYVLDGEARREGRWTQTLARLAASGGSAPVVVFSEPVQLPGPVAMQAFLGEVVPAVEETYRVDPERRSLAGTGGSSISALMLAVSNPEFAQRVAVQSIHGVDISYAPIYGSLDEAGETLLPIEFYVEWGSMDLRAIKEGWDTRLATRNFFEDLTSRGYTVHGGEVVDSTDWSSWRNRTDTVLEVLLGSEGDSSGDQAGSSE